MEQIGSRAAIFDLEGFGGDKLSYLKRFARNVQSQVAICEFLQDLPNVVWER